MAANCAQSTDTAHNTCHDTREAVTYLGEVTSAGTEDETLDDHNHDIEDISEVVAVVRNDILDKVTSTSPTRTEVRTLTVLLNAFFFWGGGGKTNC